MFKKIFSSALFAGAAAGLIFALLHLLFVQPVMLVAELYEFGDLVHFGGGTDADLGDIAISGFDFKRDGLTIIFSVLVYVGFGLVLAAAMALAEEQGAAFDLRRGMLWGAAGFVAVHLAPALGLPPELPSAAAADIGIRQVWWFSTVGATVVALWLLAFSNGPVALIVAVVLLVAPHVIGAPHPGYYNGVQPPELSGLYVARTLGVNLAGWVVLGSLAAVFWNKEQS